MNKINNCVSAIYQKIKLSSSSNSKNSDRGTVVGSVYNNYEHQYGLRFTIFTYRHKYVERYYKMSELHHIDVTEKKGLNLPVTLYIAYVNGCQLIIQVGKSKATSQ